MKCRVKTCQTQHKSPSGYCYEHAANIDKHVVNWRPTGKHELYEEMLDRATTPKRTLK